MTATLSLPPLPDLEAAVGLPLDAWAHQCHGVSLAIVRAGVLGQPCRVARGRCRGVGSQHSWVVVGLDCYASPALIVDPTLWSYVPEVEGVYLGDDRPHGHAPHGAGSIWNYGRPAPPTGPVIELAGAGSLSRSARDFLDLLGPLDRSGWSVLANSPVEGWPAGEILAAMHRTVGLSHFVPIDVLGMVTDLNPGGLYLAGPDRGEP